MSAVPACASLGVYKPRRPSLALLYIDDGSPDMHELNASIESALTIVPYEALCPGNAKLRS